MVYTVHAKGGEQKRLKKSKVRLCSAAYSPKSTWLDSTQLNTFDFVEQVETSVSSETSCSDMADDEQAYTSLVVFMLLHTQILFVLSNKIN